jgi:hypothetical protein
MPVASTLFRPCSPAFKGVVILQALEETLTTESAQRGPESHNRLTEA